MIEARLKEAALRLRRNVDTRTPCATSTSREPGADLAHLGALARLEDEMQGQVAAIGQLQQDVTTLTRTLVSVLEEPLTPTAAASQTRSVLRVPQVLFAFGLLLVGFALGVWASDEVQGRMAAPIAEFTRTMLGG
jgi:hypothetical protein